MRLLRSSAHAAAARIVIDRLDAAARAARGLRDRKDREALHDFRVGIRRLRSALRAYRPWLGRAASRTMRGRFRELAQSTNAARDAEVQRAWIRKCRKEAPGAVSSELDRLLRRSGPRARSRRLIAEEFAAIEAKLRARLAALDLGGGPRFAPVYKMIVDECVADTAAALAAVHRSNQVEAAHRARITVKRLRYVLEPVAPELPQAAAKVTALADLQDMLGELHDAQVFAEAGIHRPKDDLGAEAARFLELRNEERRERVFDALRARWLGGAAADLCEQIRALVSSA